MHQSTYSKLRIVLLVRRVNEIEHVLFDKKKQVR